MLLNIIKSFHGLYVDKYMSPKIGLNECLLPENKPLLSNIRVNYCSSVRGWTTLQKQQTLLRRRHISSEKHWSITYLLLLVTGHTCSWSSYFIWNKEWIQTIYNNKCFFYTNCILFWLFQACAMNTYLLTLSRICVALIHRLVQSLSLN